MSSAGSYGGGGSGMAGVLTITGDVGASVTGNVLLTGGTSGAIFTGSGGNTLTESFNFLALPSTNNPLTQGYISLGGSPFLSSFGDSSNVFVGIFAGNAAISGTSNVGVGFSALLNAGTTTSCTALGAQALASNVTGANCVAVGQGSLQNDSDSSFNTALGAQALNAFFSTGNANNVAVGYNSLNLIATGTDNIALGTSSGSALTTTDSSNILIGNDGVVGDNNTIRIGTQGSGAAQQNTCYIHGIYGETGTTGTEFVTIDSDGRLGSSAGGGGGVSSIAGDVGATATGAVTITGGSSGAVYTESGGNTLTTSFDFISMLDTNAGGTEGVIEIGGDIIVAMYGGVAQTNLIIGPAAGDDAMSGVDNTACGSGALNGITTGSSNTAVGSGALNGITTSASNTACGVASLVALDTGQGGNTALGTSTLTSLVSGRRNIAIGVTSGNNYTSTESDNILIANTGVIADANTLRIGTEGTGTGQQSTCFIAGIANATVTGSAVLVDVATGQLGLAVSSERYKENIQDIGGDSRTIMDLRPVKFSYKRDPNKDTQYGLIAEEVYEKMPNLLVYDKDGKPYTVKYHDLPVLLLNEIQRLESRLRAIEEQFAARVR